MVDNYINKKNLYQLLNSMYIQKHVNKDKLSIKKLKEKAVKSLY